MSRPVDVDDVLRGKPSPGTLLKRGVLKKCPRCGGGHIYDGWFHMKERCPTCGYLFEREPGFFVGAYLINFAIAEGFLFVLLMIFVGWKSQNPDAGVVWPIVVGIAIGVIGPIVFYPFSRTIWSAFDLLMTPMEMDEIVAAADAVGGEALGPDADGPLLAGAAAGDGADDAADDAEGGGDEGDDAAEPPEPASGAGPS